MASKNQEKKMALDLLEALGQPKPKSNVSASKLKELVTAALEAEGVPEDITESERAYIESLGFEISDEADEDEADEDADEADEDADEGDEDADEGDEDEEEVEEKPAAKKGKKGGKKPKSNAKAGVASRIVVLAVKHRKWGCKEIGKKLEGEGFTFSSSTLTTTFYATKRVLDVLDANNMLK